MPMLADITPLVLTYNEAPNIARTLQRLSWAREILVVDSFSTDATLDIARTFPAVRIVQRKFDTFAGQCNAGLEQIRSAWVLSLDADYRLSDELVSELESLAPPAGIAGYRVPFTYCIGGRPLRATLYPPRTVLYRKERARYVDAGHGHQVQITGDVGSLAGRIFHDDRKPFSRWLAEQNRYMIAESRHLLTTPIGELNRQDRLRRWVVVAPFAVFAYTLFAQALVLDGWPGWVYAGQRTLAETLLSLRLAQGRLLGPENTRR
jgi:glycosyltransferase involved in cell wall biosynthesis